MPTVLRVAGYRFFFFSNERKEPAHIHVEQAELRRLVFQYRLLVQEAWDGHIGGQA